MKLTLDNIIERLDMSPKPDFDESDSVRKAKLTILGFLRELRTFRDSVRDGKLVQLPQERWCVTEGGGPNNPNYLVEQQVPVGTYSNGKWTFEYPPIEWRKIIEWYPTKLEAMRRCQELES